VSAPEIRHDPQRSAYEYVLDGVVIGVADYRSTGDRIEMHHTYTDPAHRGQGIAATLVAAALDDVRRRDLRVVPTCWFVAGFIDSHPEYRDLATPP
jgi:predicted GNAT family acetyltransferase